jgi:hypothetical protein
MSTSVTIDCVCPPKDDAVRHSEGDTVGLRDKLGFRDATAIRNGLLVLRSEDPDADVAEIAAVRTEGYSLHGVESWSITDAKGKPLPVDRGAIRRVLLSDPSAAWAVGEAADTLYSDAVTAPLVKRAQGSSPPTSDDAPTSPTTDGSDESPTPSKLSLTSITPTDATAKTSRSRAGGSRSSRSSRSAA